MVKTPKGLKKSNLKLDFEARVNGLFAAVPFLNLESFQLEPRLFQDQSYRPDWLAKVRVGNRLWTLLGENKQLGEPRIVRSGVLQLEDYLRHLSKDKRCYGVMLAPFISSKSATICLDAGMGYADLAGNVHLCFDHVYIDIRTGQNPFREKRDLRSLFTPKAGRILRVLLTPPLRSWKVEELGKESGVSLGHVSNVRKKLLDREWAHADDAGLRLTKPEELARAWQNAYESRSRERTKYYSVLHGEEIEIAIRAALSEAGTGERAVLASFSAARWLAPYTRQSTHFFYADAIGTEVLRRHLQLETTSKGENIVIEEPREDDVFTRRLEPVSGIWCSGLLQTWLDLGTAGERGREAAEHLLQHKLLPNWKENS